MSDWPALDELIATWASRKVVSAQGLIGVSAEEKASSFWLARQWDTKFVGDLQASIEKAITEGTSFADWLKGAQDIVDGYGGTFQLYASEGLGKIAPWYADLVYRNATQAGFAGGRYTAMFDPERLRLVPYVQYRAILDARTRPAHRALNGRVFRKDDPSARQYFPPSSHNCFPAETPILGAVRRGFANRYSGDVIRVETRSGNRLTLTVNHPVLTPGGWVTAKELRQGDHVLSDARRGEGGLDAERTNEAVLSVLGSHQARRLPPRLNVDGRPAFAGELFRSLPEAFRERGSVVRTKDLYGDPEIRKRHVEVESEDRELLDNAHPRSTKPRRDLGLPLVHVDHSLVASLRRACEGFGRSLLAASSFPGFGELAFDGGAVVLQGGPFHPLRGALAAKFDPEIAEGVPKHQAASPAFVREALQGLSSLVARSQVSQPRDREAGRSFEGSVLLRDELVSVRAGRFDGDVFDFETAHGWMVAGGIVISNCRCFLIDLDQTDFEDGGFQLMSGADIPQLELPGGGGVVGLPPEGWGVDRVEALRSHALAA